MDNKKIFSLSLSLLGFFIIGFLLLPQTVTGDFCPESDWVCWLQSAHYYCSGDDIWRECYWHRFHFCCWCDTAKSYKKIIDCGSDSCGTAYCSKGGFGGSITTGISDYEGYDRYQICHDRGCRDSQGGKQHYCDSYSSQDNNYGEKWAEGKCDNGWNRAECYDNESENLVEDCGNSGWDGSYKCFDNVRKRWWIERGCHQGNGWSGCYERGRWKKWETCPYCCSGDRCTGVCHPNDTKTEGSCGNCGTKSYKCSSSCNWVYQSCVDQGVCSSGSTQSQSCGNCGTQTRTCQGNCQWGSYGSCVGQGVCSPGSTESCGSCGTKTCKSNCTWDLSDCNNCPTATNLNIDYKIYCGITPETGIVGFKWTYSDPDGDFQTRFDFQVDNNAGFSSPEIARSFNVSRPSPNDNTQAVLIVTSPQSDKITYTPSPYHWRVRVYDDRGGNSGWKKGPSFSVARHAWPWTDFTFSPDSPSVGEIVQFQDKSEVYGGTAINNWNWTFQDAVPSTSNQQNPEVIFNNQGPREITLEVTDTDGYMCPLSRTVNVTLPLPKWREVAP